MSSISNGVRATFEHAHKLLQLCINSLQAFNGYNHRLQFPGDYTRGAVPWECQSPETLWHLWQQMRRDIDSLEIDYFHAPGTSVDIIRALKASPVPIAPILATEATTHIEALCEIASQISGRFSIVSESLPKLFDEASDDDVARSAEAATALRDYLPNDQLPSDALTYLRRSIFTEEETCRRFFNHETVPAPRGKPGRKSDPIKTAHALSPEATLFERLRAFESRKRPKTWGLAM